MATGSGRPPTIRDVAARAGVSKSLVSLVLNDSPLVRPPKRAAVEAAVRELGYRPNAAARRLNGRPLGIVGVLTHDLRQSFHADMVEALNSAFHVRDMTVLLGDAQFDERADARLAKAFVTMRVDGLVLVGSMTPTPAVEEAVARMPTVVVASLDVVRPRIDLAVQDDSAGARLATEHLITLGHTRVAHVSGSFGAAIDVRRRAYEEAMRDAGLEALTRVVVEDLTESGGYRAATELLREPGRPTALFVAADAAAVGAVRAALDLGLRVPQDVSVIGFDNATASRAPGVELSSVDIDVGAMAQHAVELLQDRIVDPGRRRRVRRTRAELVVRRTTGPPATAS